MATNSNTPDDTEGASPQPGQDNIVRSMARTAHAMRRYLETNVGEVPGGMSSWHVLRMLHKCGPTTQAQLARWAGVAGSTLTRRLEQMEDDGLITRADDPDDGRRIIVTMTDKAAALIAEQHTRMDGEIDKLTAGASPADIEAVNRVLATIDANLTELGVDLEARRGGRGRGFGSGSGPGGPRGGRGRGRGRGHGPGGRGDHGDHSDHAERGPRGARGRRGRGRRGDSE